MYTKIWKNFIVTLEITRVKIYTFVNHLTSRNLGYKLWSKLYPTHKTKSKNRQKLKWAIPIQNDGK